MNRQNSFSSENDNFSSEKSIGIQMSTSPKTIVTVHEFHLHYSDFYDCGFKSLVMVAFVNGFFNPKSRKRSIFCYYWRKENSALYRGMVK